MENIIPRDKQYSGFKRKTKKYKTTGKKAHNKIKSIYIPVLDPEEQRIFFSLKHQKGLKYVQ